jgi:hypothetical protein
MPPGSKGKSRNPVTDAASSTTRNNKGSTEQGFKTLQGLQKFITAHRQTHSRNTNQANTNHQHFSN